MSTSLEEMDGIFDDHPSLNASLQDFEHGSEPGSPILHQFAYPSHHSGFQSGYRTESEDEMTSEASTGNYSPPAFRRINGGNHRDSGWWRKGEDLMNGRMSRETSPDYESAMEGDATLAVAARTKLPPSRLGTESPQRQRSPSPGPYPMGGGDFRKSPSAVKIKKEDSEEPPKLPAADEVGMKDNTNNYIRFAMRAEMQHRSEPFESALSFLQSKFAMMTRSWSSLTSSLLIGLFSLMAYKILFAPSVPTPAPDLVKVAGLARAFEPLIYYSENGINQIGDLEATGIAVWDLSESVRSTNMTSAPIIVRELDELGQSLKTLAHELTRFFASVDGDVDAILIVMDWAKRELAQIQSIPTNSATIAYSNIYNIASHLGLFETGPGEPTKLGLLFTSVFGPSLPQQSRQTLQRTFTEFVSVLEESITNELTYSTNLFALFESIDQQFLNLARTVVRESDEQERLESDLLASLWTRALGSNGKSLRKYEKNKQLLQNVRAKTVMNKSLLIDHNGKLLTLKANLEHLRRRLVSPLVRADNSSRVGVEEQIRGLDGVYGHLYGVRERQKGKMMEALYGAGSRIGRQAIVREDRFEIEGNR